MRFSPFGMFRRKEVFARSAVRHSCQIDCELLLTDSMVSYEGRLIDISIGGAMFRPKLAYLMYRRNEPIALRLGTINIIGEIVATNGAGFGLRFEAPLDENALLAMLASYAMPEAQAA